MLKKTALVFVAVVIALAAAEIALRAWFPLYLTGAVDSYRYDAETGITLKSDLNSLKMTDYLQEIVTNRLGTVNYQQSFDHYARLVFAAGDSYTQGSGLPADAAYPFQLDLLLNNEHGHYQPAYGVVNLGVASYGGRQSLLRLQHFIHAVGRPDYILYLVSSNDAMDDRLFEQGYRHRHLVDGNPYWGVWLKPLQWLGHECEIGKRVRLAWTMFKRRAATNHKPATGKPRISVAEQELPVLRQLQQIATHNHARLIIGWSGPPMHDDGSYGWMKQWAAENGTGFADWQPAVAADQQAMPSLAMANPHSGGHYRSWVQRRIAMAYAEAMRR